MRLEHSRPRVSVSCESENFRRQVKDVYVESGDKNLKAGKTVRTLGFLLVFTLSSIVIACNFGAFPTASSQGVGPLVTVWPTYVEAEVGQNFTINVRVDNLTDGYAIDPWNTASQIPLGRLYGVDLQFSWDPTVIHCVSHTKKIPVETYPDGVMHSPTLTLRDTVNETASIPNALPGTRYWLVEASLLPAASFNGGGIFVTMIFNVLKAGQSPLEITDLTLSNPEGYPIGESQSSGNWLRSPVDGMFSTPGARSYANLVHVGVTGDMFWGGVNVSDSSFTGWTMLPGKTGLSVASAVSDGKLCVVHVGVNNDMFWGFVKLPDSTFSGWTILPGRTSLSVTAVASGGTLYIVHVGMNHEMFWGSVNLTDSSFSGWTILPGMTYLRPAAAALGSTLYLAHVGVTGDMFWGGVNVSDSSFTGWTMLPGKTSLSMALTVSEGKLYTVHVGVHNEMFRSSVNLSNSAFSGWTILPGKTNLSAEATAFGGKLYVAHVGVNDDMFLGSVDLSDSSFAGWTMLPGKTYLSVSVA